MKERRSFLRFKVGVQVQWKKAVAPNERSALHISQVKDVSAGGVKIIAEHLELPPEFTIILSDGGPRQCRLAWRIGCEFGAQFVD